MAAAAAVAVFSFAVGSGERAASVARCALLSAVVRRACRATARCPAIGAAAVVAGNVGASAATAGVPPSLAPIVSGAAEARRGGSDSRSNQPPRATSETTATTASDPRQANAAAVISPHSPTLPDAQTH